MLADRLVAGLLVGHFAEKTTRGPHPAGAMNFVNGGESAADGPRQEVKLPVIDPTTQRADDVQIKPASH